MFTIRREQMDVFCQCALQQFEDRKVRDIATAFPIEYEEMLDPQGGDGKARELVRKGVEKAASYGVEIERNVWLFIDLMVQLSPDFDEEPAMRTAREVLEDKELAEGPKIALVYAELEARGLVSIRTV
ncbi:MAG TPA: hypothetical protein VNE39_19810 [Planctomycetota bacterium]|nr:hypothetical protein [Planctomycetota bacterium]